HVTDLFKKGNSAGIIFGQPLKRVNTGGIAINPENRTPYQIEGFFNFRLNDNLSITPGVFAIFNPEGRSENDTAIVPVIRSTFTF
ncbi:MAG: S-layer protein, partial [Leptolyngbya sp. ERB_1_2]